MGLKLLAAGSEEFARSDRGIEAATAVSDGRGAFTFVAVPPGTYKLKASRSDLVRSAQSPDASTFPSMWWAEESVSVGEAGLKEIRVLLKPGLRVRGRLEFAGSQPPPSVRGASVGLSSAATGQSDRSSAGLVAGDGTFVTSGDLPGGYYLNAILPRGWTVRSISHGGRDVSDSLLELVSEDLDVLVTLTDKIARLSGTLTDRNGARDPRGNVVVFPADADGWRRGAFNPRRVRRIVASTAGTFAIEDLPAGEYFVVAVGDESASRWAAPGFLEKLVPQASRVTIAEGDKKTVALTTSSVK